MSDVLKQSSRWNSGILNLGGALGITWFCKGSEAEDGGGAETWGQHFSFLSSPAGPLLK